MSLERRYILRAYGAEIVLTPAGDGNVRCGQQGAALARRYTGGVHCRANSITPPNRRATKKRHGVGDLEQTGNAVAAFVSGVGTGGTVTGRRSYAEEPARRGPSKCSPSSPANSRGAVRKNPPGCTAIQGARRRLRAAHLGPFRDRQCVGSDGRSRRAHGAALGARRGAARGSFVGWPMCMAACEVAASSRAGNVVTILCDSGASATCF